MNENLILTRLVTGEIVIGKKEGEKIVDPYVIVARPVGASTIRFELSPYFLSFYDTSEKPYIPIDKVVAFAKPQEDISHKYIEMSSGIVIPKNFDTSKLDEKGFRKS